MIDYCLAVRNGGYKEYSKSWEDLSEIDLEDSTQ